MPAKGGPIQERAPAWGITPVPERLRTLGGFENGMLWSSLGLSLLVLVAGAFLVPALSLPEALLAILVGGIFGNALLGCAAGIGAEQGECREVGQVDAVVEDERGLDAAVGKERLAGELREAGPVRCHEIPLIGGTRESLVKRLR